MIEPIKARSLAIFSLSNFGHRIPGVSSSSTVLLSLIHCFPFVTPGLLPVFAQALPAKEFINVDLPTLGIPTIIALTGRLMIPLFLSLSIFSLQTSRIALLTDFIPLRCLESSLITFIPCFSKNSTHFTVTLSSARSDLLSRISLYLFFARSSISGFLLDIGILASISSMTISLNLISSCIILFALVI